VVSGADAAGALAPDVADAGASLATPGLREMEGVSEGVASDDPTAAGLDAAGLDAAGSAATGAAGASFAGAAGAGTAGSAEPIGRLAFPAGAAGSVVSIGRLAFPAGAAGAEVSIGRLAFPAAAAGWAGDSVSVLIYSALCV